MLAPFDVRCSRAHVTALESGGILDADDAAALRGALDRVAGEIDDGSFAAWATAQAFEDVHGAIDARVREYAGPAGERLHAGRSRNDQVATTLLLYARDRARQGAELALDIAASIEVQAVRRARTRHAARRHDALAARAAGAARVLVGRGGAGVRSRGGTVRARRERRRAVLPARQRRFGWVVVTARP